MTKPPKFDLATAIVYAVGILILLSVMYAIMLFRCNAWNSATNDNLTVWEWMWLPTRYTGPGGH